MRNEHKMALIKKFPRWEFRDKEGNFYEDTITIKRHKRERAGGSLEVTGDSTAAIGGA